MPTALPEGYELDDDPGRIDVDAVHRFVAEAYWAKRRSRDVVAAAIAGSARVVGLYHHDEQVGFARVVSDGEVIAYLADVYVLEAHRGQRLAHAMLDWLDGHPDLQGLRRWILFTQDAQGLYASHQWTPYPHPERLMVRDRPDIYA